MREDRDGAAETHGRRVGGMLRSTRVLLRPE